MATHNRTLANTDVRFGRHPQPSTLSQPPPLPSTTPTHRCLTTTAASDDHPRINQEAVATTPASSTQLPTPAPRFVTIVDEAGPDAHRHVTEDDHQIPPPIATSLMLTSKSSPNDDNPVSNTLAVSSAHCAQARITLPPQPPDHHHPVNEVNKAQPPDHHHPVNEVNKAQPPQPPPPLNEVNEAQHPNHHHPVNEVNEAQHPNHHHPVNNHPMPQDSPPPVPLQDPPTSVTTTTSSPVDETQRPL
ncbi:hypothetical protein K443DRAFT_3855 [Laccaria amethystina LaAM-08-1]|uniref:Uncharacterized protein n=1 Tax=Laccaria amethystina LaAM-08-1 TaxID=1095629 RepID=A0A0C9Y5C9_9AGAR|nr:hypothetical protein K443DRAFT_3855 [Laccaria amethystina LaAM-08-1]